MSKKLDSVLSNAEAMQYNHVVDDFGVPDVVLDEQHLQGGRGGGRHT